MAKKKTKESEVMKNEIQTVDDQLVTVSKNAVKELKVQRQLLKEFVQSQLVEADYTDPKSPSYGEGDYGIIPGTKKRCLLKPGAEKLNRLFQLGARFTLTDKEIDRVVNFASYTYSCEIYSLRTGTSIANCEGAANSQEVKYKERTVWKNNSKGIRESSKEETPIYDVINTLMKMAQKRALIGATLLATGASEYFTQDMLDPEDIKNSESETKDVTPKVEPKKDDHAQQEAPVCCGKQMMISKWVDKDLGHAPWYCMTCRSKKPLEGAA